ncbi:MAG: phosphoenolpyruvate carboxykinase (ATP) [Chitinophagales bacterium]|nr:phosphoenolpyruvate carboxykinase (ATP) [Bacteroidota bacterium]MCB9043829.1 phosphoenolpyruvate carboxykinase (ATP) [Chitinophagales bacterium]
MKIIGHKNAEADLSHLGIVAAMQYWNLTPAELVEHTILKKMGHLSDTGALAIDTGKFTGRSPQDRFIVKDAISENDVDWGKVNIAFSPEKFDALYDRVCQYLSDKEIYVRDAQACSYSKYRMNIRVITEYPWQNLFADNMFIRPELDSLASFVPHWHVISAPGFLAEPERDGTRQGNFAILNFTRKTIIIGGTGYTGEIKKGIFSALNFLLPTLYQVLPMHCSANVGKKEDTAIFFGLSGTGKTTLSADVNRRLIGDDEHGWSSGRVFNFEGGCYAKCINLDPEKEPQIYKAITFGALLENINFFPGTRTVDYTNIEKTENTRVSYPIELVPNTVRSQMGGNPRNIFFLTCDAFGVLPPISKLTPAQAMYHFMSGYTAKVAGTEMGITEPQTTFSAGFGSPFLPLHPSRYASMLGEKIRETNANVWLVNTGWTGGPYGTGTRIKLKDTRAIIKAALDGVLDNVVYEDDPVFGLRIPAKCPDVKSALLHPVQTWENEATYYEIANKLAQKFIDNFKKFEAETPAEILAASPTIYEHN